MMGKTCTSWARGWGGDVGGSEYALQPGPKLLKEIMMVCFSCENNVRKLISKYAHQHNGKFLIVYFPRNRYCETPISEAGSYFEVEP